MEKISHMEKISIPSWVGILNIVQMTILSKLMDIIPIKTPEIYVCIMNKHTLKFVWKCKEPRTVKTILKK